MFGILLCDIKGHCGRTIVDWSIRFVFGSLHYCMNAFVSPSISDGKGPISRPKGTARLRMDAKADKAGMMCRSLNLIESNF